MAGLELKQLEFGEGLAEWKEFRKQMMGFGGTGKDDRCWPFGGRRWGALVRSRMECWLGKVQEFNCNMSSVAEAPGCRQEGWPVT